MAPSARMVGGKRAILKTRTGYGMRTEHIVDGFWEMPGGVASTSARLGTTNKLSHRSVAVGAGQEDHRRASGPATRLF